MKQNTYQQKNKTQNADSQHVNRQKHNRKEKKAGWFTGLGLLLLILMTTSLIWGLCNYGNIRLEEIIFTLRMPLKGVSYNYYLSFFFGAIVSGLAAWVLLLCLGKLLSFHPGKKIFLLYSVWFLALCGIANASFDVSDYVKSQLMQSDFLEEHYVDPNEVELQFPEQKRNLIMIYMESAETSAQDKDNGGIMETNYIPEMTQLAYDHISFSHSDVLEGAAVAPACGWTMAGLVAETSGLPLKLFTYDDSRVDNSMRYYQYFLPGVSSLGDVLEREGYHNCFMAGSDFDFGGRTNYFTQHGNYEICDLKWARKAGKVAADYSNGFWGLEDRQLYGLAKEKLLELAASDQPFNLSVLTVDTHQPNGYLCDLCERNYLSDYGNVWACASKQVADFVEWISMQDFYDNTSVVILGDHCSMVSGFYGVHSYDKHNGSVERKVYNAFIHPAADPVSMKNRAFTTMDFFPTILGSLGVDIPGGRLGIGTNLFSDRQTLLEQYGAKEMFEELNKKSSFYNEELLYP